MIKILIGIVIIALLGVGGFLYYQSNQKKLSSPPANTIIEITPTEEPPTPTPEEVVKDAYEIDVQNGSGVAGRAAAVKKTLEDEDFIVSNAGNADDDTYLKTIIYASEEVSKGYLDELRSILSRTYELQEGVEDIADIKSDAKVAIVIGKNETKEENSEKNQDEESDSLVTPTAAKE